MAENRIMKSIKSCKLTARSIIKINETIMTKNPNKVKLMKKRAVNKIRNFNLIFFPENKV